MSLTMFFKRFIAFLIITVSASAAVNAEELFITRVHLTFPEAMLKLQEVIRKQGYTVSRVQRVDIGLTKSGYKTDKYRVVFFGKADEVNTISQQYPHLIAYIPWKIAIFAEDEETLLVTANPLKLENKAFPKANAYLKKWEKDIDLILAEMRKPQEN